MVVKKNHLQDPKNVLPFYNFFPVTIFTPTDLLDAQPRIGYVCSTAAKIF